MKLHEEQNQTKIGKLTQEILKLQQELDELYSEHNRVKDLIETEKPEQPFRPYLNQERDRELFEAIVDNIPVMITIYDPELKNFRFNKEMKQITGWTEEDAASGNFVEKVYPDPIYREEVINFMKSLEPGWKEWLMTCKNGDLLISSWANILLTSGIQIGIGIDIRERRQAEQKLRESEQRLQATFNNAAIGIVEVDTNDCFIAANDCICKMLGYSREELLGKNVSEITFPEDRLVSKGINETIHSGIEKTQTYEKRYMKKQGTPIWVHVTVSGVYNSEGKHINSIGTVEDISERKNTETALRESEERFRMLADNISQMAWISSKDGMPIWFNKRWFDFTGVSLEEMQQGGHVRVNHPEHSARVFKNFQQTTLEGKVWEETYMMKSKNGEYRWFLSRSSPIFDENGNITLWFGTSTDIHERKIAEEQALARATEIEAILSCIPDGVLVYDKESRIIRSNTAASNILKYGENDKNAKIEERVLNYFEVFTEEGRLLTPEEMPAYRASIKGEHLKKEILLVKRDEESRWVLFNAAPLIISGKHTGGVLSMHDITSRKHMEEQLRKSEEQFRMLADNITQITWVTNYKGEILWYNKQWYDYTGKSIDEIQQKGFEQVLHPEHSKRVLETFYNSLKTGEPWEAYYPLLGKNGEYRWFLGRAVPIRDENGKVNMWFGTNTDITDQRKVEETLRNSEQRLEAIFNNAAIGIVELDIDTQFIMVNNRICEILGYSRDELLNKTAIDITAPEDKVHSKYLYDGLNSGNFNILNYEKRYIKKDGSLLWVHVSVSAIRDNKGRHLRSIGTVEDINERKLTEAKLKEALKKAEEGKNILTALMEYIPLGIIISDAPDVNFRMVSKYVKNLIKTDNDSIEISALENSFKQAIYYNDGVTLAHPDELPLSRAIKKGEIVKNEEWLLSDNKGTLIPILCNAAPILNRDEEIVGGVMGWQDITESRKILEDLRHSEERYRSVIDAANLGTWEFDVKTGVINHSLRHDQIFGYKEYQTEWTFETLLQHFFPEYHQTLINAYEVALNAGGISYEAKIRWPDGSVHWINPHGKIYYDKHGNPLRMAGIIADVTERKMAEEALKESEEKFRLLFESITEGVALHQINYDEEGPVRYCIIDSNPAFKEFTSYKIKTTKDFDAIDVFQATKFPYLKEFEHVGETRKPLTFESSFSDTGKHFIINVISPKKGQFATVLEDITEQKRIEQELKLKNEELTRFIYTVSHDLKSPLVTIKSFAAYLKEDVAINDYEAQTRDISYITNAADRMGRLLDELLELSRIGRTESSKTNVLLKDVAQAALDMVAGRLSQKNIQVKFAGPSVMLYGNVPRLIQLYQNLIDNAAKFMGNRPNPEIEIGALAGKSKQKPVVLFVRDNGSGIDPKYHHKLFDLFEKLDNSTEGTGIGLALVKRIIEVHSGTVWVKSEGEGKGTTFFFTLEKSQIV